MSDLDMQDDDFAELMGDLVRAIISDDLEALQAHLSGLSGADLRRMKGLAYGVVGVIEVMGSGNE